MTIEWFAFNSVKSESLSFLLEVRTTRPIHFLDSSIWRIPREPEGVSAIANEFQNVEPIMSWLKWFEWLECPDHLKTLHFNFLTGFDEA